MDTIDTAASLKEAIKEQQAVTGNFFCSFPDQRPAVVIGWDGQFFVARFGAEEPTILDEEQIAGLLPLNAGNLH